MNHIDSIISEFINLFNQQMKKLVQSSYIVYCWFFFFWESPKKLYEKLCIYSIHQILKLDFDLKKSLSIL